MKISYITTDDNVKLAYSDKGYGKTVVLIAGYGAPASSWCLQEKALLNAGYRVICFDRRSHGASENPTFGQNMERQGKDINCLLTELKLSDVVLIGQSQGASSIFSYISQFGTDKLLGICDIDQTPKMINDDSWNFGMYDLNVNTRPKYFDAPLGAPNKAPINKKILFNVLMSSIGRMKFDEENTKPLLLDHADANWIPVLENIDVPALFIAGELSPFWPKEHALAAAQICEKGISRVVLGSGHAVNWEFPEEVNKIILEFIRNI